MLVQDNKTAFDVAANDEVKSVLLGAQVNYKMNFQQIFIWDICRGIASEG